MSDIISFESHLYDVDNISDDENHDHPTINKEFIKQVFRRL